MIVQLLYAFLISIPIVALAFWRGSLSRSGAWAALLVGTLIFGLGGWRWGILLGGFFVSSTLLVPFIKFLDAAFSLSGREKRRNGRREI